MCAAPHRARAAPLLVAQCARGRRSMHARTVCAQPVSRRFVPPQPCVARCVANFLRCPVPPPLAPCCSVCTAFTPPPWRLACTKLACSHSRVVHTPCASCQVVAAAAVVGLAAAPDTARSLHLPSRSCAEHATRTATRCASCLVAYTPRRCSARHNRRRHNRRRRNRRWSCRGSRRPRAPPLRHSVPRPHRTARRPRAQPRPTCTQIRTIRGWIVMRRAGLCRT